MFDAVDILTHGNVTQTSLIRQIEIGSAYAVLTVKGKWYVGEPISVIESLGIWYFAPCLIFYISFSFISLILFEIVGSDSAKTLTRLMYLGVHAIFVSFFMMTINTLENTEGAIKLGQSRKPDNI